MDASRLARKVTPEDLHHLATWPIVLVALPNADVVVYSLDPQGSRLRDQSGGPHPRDQDSRPTAILS